ncbi:MAG: hypothetical protein GVY32_12085 [Gammaproteobacteria bacterium]|jgi:KDO2-lipid IV(A) lauroyltransferase|nr:hypothetical protein [Gammaproteobacteria bacterium]
MIESLTWLLLQPVRLLGRLPPGPARALMRPIGLLIYWAMPSRRRIAERNLELCFPEFSPEKRRRTLRRHFRLLGEMLAEGAIAWCRPGRLDERFGSVEGLEHLERASASGKGVLVLTGHATSLELAGRLVGERWPMHGVYRPQRNQAVERFQNDGRLHYAEGMFRREQLRGMVRHLRRGGTLWYAPDQDFGPQRSIFVPFFGLPAATATGIFNLARMGDAVVLGMYPLRDAATGRVRVVIEAPFEDFPSGDRARGLACYNAFLEKHIRQDPAQYFWVHRRFKTTPEGEPDRYPGIRRRRSKRRRGRSGQGSQPRLMFAPASGPGGSGEYYRCLALARAVSEAEPEAEIEFLLSREARVERDERFAYHELSATPARAGDEVIRLIERRRPSLAVFDCTGRVAQFRAAQLLGCRVAWISNRPRKRAKGFRPRQMRWTDLHVIVDSLSPRPRLRWYERGLLRLFPRVEIELVEAVVARADEAALAPWRPDLPAEGAFALFVAGGGGYGHQGRPVPEIFLDAARRFRRASGRPAVVVLGPQYRGDAAGDEEVTVIRELPSAALGVLLARAQVAVVGAGNMLSSQALAAGVPLVITAVGGRDQPRRVRRLAKAGRARPAGLEPEALARAALERLEEGDSGAGPSRPEDDGGETQRVARRLLDLAAGRKA